MTNRRNRTAITGTAATIVVAMGMLPVAASAQPEPAPSDVTEAEQRYERLGARAARTNEELLSARQDLRNKQDELERANTALERARFAERRAEERKREVRDRVDDVVLSTYQGARLDEIAALLNSESPDAFLDRRTMLAALAADENAALDTHTRATRRAAEARRRAEEARRRAREAKLAAERLTEKLERREAELREQAEQVRRAMERLSSETRADLGTVQDSGSYSGPPGVANTALQAALSKRGSEYEWGAEGPDQFDCSGLTSWAYARAGIDIPRTSRGQYGVGSPVSRGQLRPGDLLFYDDGTGNPSRIHHVGMYVGDGKMVDAPTEGQLVDVRSMEGDGHYIGARRIAG